MIHTKSVKIFLGVFTVSMLGLTGYYCVSSRPDQSTLAMSSPSHTVRMPSTAMPSVGMPSAATMSAQPPGIRSLAPIAASSSAKKPTMPSGQSPGHVPDSHLKNLSTLVGGLKDGLESEAAAARAMKTYQECLDKPDQENYRQVQGICVQYARLVAERFPVFKERAVELARKGEPYLNHAPGLPAPRAPAAAN